MTINAFRDQIKKLNTLIGKETGMEFEQNREGIKVYQDNELVQIITRHNAEYVYKQLVYFVQGVELGQESAYEKIRKHYRK